MKLGLIGYGKMGKLVEQTALQRGHTTPYKKSLNTSQGNVEEVDLLIDFSHPDSVVENVKRFSQMKKNLVIGTTGWYQDLERVKEIVKSEQTGLIYAPNFSLGVHLFMQIVAQAAEILSSSSEYDVSGFELHHQQKADSPSGTAKAMIDLLLKKIPRKKKAVYELGNRKKEPDELQFTSVRCGSIPGTHTLLFDSSADTISLTHQARNREGFALGAVVAAEWLQDKKGFFTLDSI